MAASQPYLSVTATDEGEKRLNEHALTTTACTHNSLNGLCIYFTGVTKHRTVRTGVTYRSFFYVKR